MVNKEKIGEVTKVNETKFYSILSIITGLSGYLILAYIDWRIVVAVFLIHYSNGF